MFSKKNIREGYRKGSLEELSGDIEDCLEDGLINKKEFNEFKKLYRSADYMSTRYLFSLYNIEKKGTWKTIGKATSDNL